MINGTNCLLYIYSPSVPGRSTIEEDGSSASEKKNTKRERGREQLKSVGYCFFLLILTSRFILKNWFVINFKPSIALYLQNVNYFIHSPIKCGDARHKPRSDKQLNIDELNLKAKSISSVEKSLKCQCNVNAISSK